MPPERPPRAYSYVRFSTAEQLKGRSLERQTEAATNYCKQHGLLLDTELSLHDLGVSAFRGKNADAGALGQFLKAVHAGAVPRGSYLLIETFDRMSRESAYDAQLTLQNIIHAGITVVTLLDGKQYNVNILRADPLALVYAILLMSRGHEESATKSKRALDAWRRKRQRLRTGEILTSVTPAWIRLDQRRKPRLIPERARVVKRMFALYLAGYGKQRIAEEFNRKRIPTFVRARYWSGRYVQRCLMSRACIGEFQPHREDLSSRTRKRIPDGPPVPNYFPAVVDRRTFDRVQTLIQKAASTPVARGRPLASLLAGLARCPLCDGLMTRTWKADGQPAKLVCTRAKAGAGCTCHGVRVDLVEGAILAAAERLIEPDPDPALTSRLADMEAAVRMLDARLLDLAVLLDDTPSRVLALKLQQAEAERDAVLADLEALRSQLADSEPRLARANAANLRSELTWYAMQRERDAVPRVNAALRNCFTKVVIDYREKRLVMHWRAGAPTVLPY